MALKEEQRLRVPAMSKGHDQIPYRAHVLHFHDQAILADLPQAQSIDHIAGGTIVFLGKIEIVSGGDFPGLKVRPPLGGVAPFQSKSVRDEVLPPLIPYR